MDIPWNHQARLLRTTGGGEETVATGVLQQLVAAFLERSPEEQNGLVLRAAGPDWAREWGAAEVRELAARPEVAGAFGRWDSALDPDAPAETDAPEERNLIEAGVSGPTGQIDDGVGSHPADRPGRTDR